MFEILNNLENKSNEYVFSRERGTNLVIQFLVDGYLRRKEQPSMKSLLNAENLNDEPGLIYNYHIAILQMMIKEELEMIGLDIINEIAKTGEKYELGNLSSLEIKYLNNKLENVVGLLINVIIILRFKSLITINLFL